MARNGQPPLGGSGYHRVNRMVIRICLLVVVLVSTVAVSSAQTEPGDPDTRAATIAALQAEKAQQLAPYQPDRAERLVSEIEEILTGGFRHWHPFFDSAYRGGGFTLGAGYLAYVGDYDTLDTRASVTPAGYIRAESEYRVPRLFDRRGSLSVIGGWRQATEVGYYGLGTANTSKDDATEYSFTQPYVSGTLEVRPTRRWLTLTAGAEYSKWDPGPGRGPGRSIEEVHTPETAPGLFATPTYLQILSRVALDTRASAGYARRGGFYGVTAASYHDPDQLYGFSRFEYEAIQHVPVSRDAWVLSLRGKVETTSTRDGEIIPFFMLPALGGGSDLRGFTSWRFRDRHSLLLQAEWRVLINSFFDLAAFYDAGKVTSRRADLDFTGLKSDLGIGIRLHSLTATPLRVDFARSNEGLHLVFSANAVF